MPRQAIPVMHGYPLPPPLPPRALNPDVAVVALCLVLHTRGLFSFLMFFGAVMVLDERVNLRRIVCGAIGALLGLGDWIAHCVPVLRDHQAAQPPDGVVAVAQAVGEMVDQMLHH